MWLFAVKACSLLIQDGVVGMAWFGGFVRRCESCSCRAGGCGGPYGCAMMSWGGVWSWGKSCVRNVS